LTYTLKTSMIIKLKDDDRKEVDACRLYRELPGGERRKRRIALNTFRELRAEGIFLRRLCRVHPLQCQGVIALVEVNVARRL
jgi:hypothetical protein